MFVINNQLHQLKLSATTLTHKLFAQQNDIKRNDNTSSYEI